MNQSLPTPRRTILIREANPTDASLFRELRLYALQESPIAFTSDYQKNLSYPPEYWEETLTMHADESTIFLAEHEGQLIGMAGISRGNSPKTRHGAWIWGVFVRPEWRGLHIAEELIHCCFTWAKTRKIILVKLGVTASNISAFRCYERCGFRTYGTEPQAVFYDGKYFDEYLMSCLLDNGSSSKE